MLIACYDVAQMIQRLEGLLNNFVFLMTFFFVLYIVSAVCYKLSVFDTLDYYTVLLRL